MDPASGEFLRELVYAFGLCGAIYGGIRADLKGIHSKLDTVKADADEAHRRLDRHLETSRR